MATKDYDPVCGMEVPTGQAVGESEYKGHAYYFCSEDCREQFESDPGKFVSEAEPLSSVSSADRSPKQENL
jgi:YHS domain-containing protein